MSQQLSPYDNYEFLRKSGDIHWTGRTWLAVRYDTVAEGLAHENLSARRVDQMFGTAGAEQEFKDLRETLTSWTFFSDAADAKAERKFIWDRLGPNALADIPELVVTLTKSCLVMGDSTKPSIRRFDVLAELTGPLRLAIVRRFLALQTVDEAELKSSLIDSDQIFEFITSSQPSRAQVKSAALSMMRLKGVLSSSGLIHPDGLEKSRVLDQLTLLMVVSIFIEKAIANCITKFAEDKSAWSLVQENSVSIGTAVTEALRLESPTQITSRVARTDFEWCGQKIRKGDPVALVIGSANRDEEPFPQANRFDGGRSGLRPLTFGLGGKRCPGEWLTSTILEKVFEVFAREKFEFRIAPDGLNWLVNPESRRPTKLLLEF